MLCITGGSKMDFLFTDTEVEPGDAGTLASTSDKPIWAVERKQRTPMTTLDVEFCGMFTFDFSREGSELE